MTLLQTIKNNTELTIATQLFFMAFDDLGKTPLSNLLKAC